MINKDTNYSSSSIIYKMQLKKKKISTFGIKFSVIEGKKEIGRGFLYLMYNDLHKKPFGLMEDIFIVKEKRKYGIGTMIVKEVIREAKKKCYKLIATSRFSRPKVHKFYKHLGFKKQGIEFRMDF